MFKDFNKVKFNYNKLNLTYRQTRYNSSYSSDNMGSYLAGLIEGDGHIAVHDKNYKSKVYRPKILIVFNINDKPLAKKLSIGLKIGRVIDKSSAGHVLLQILAKDEVLKVINLINGHMRTPKIEALHRSISWINERDNSFIPCLGLDTSPLDSNS
jgi:LAGLIDADG endonuclease